MILLPRRLLHIVPVGTSPLLPRRLTTCIRTSSSFSNYRQTSTNSSLRNEVKLPCSCSWRSTTFYCRYDFTPRNGVKHYSSTCSSVQASFLNTNSKLTPKRTLCSRVVDQNKQPSMKVLFFGTDFFSLTCLQSLFQNRSSSGLIQQLDVVVPQTKYIKKKRKKDIISPVLKYAQENDLKVYYWPMKEEVKGYDLGVVASFGHLIPGKIINSFPHGVLNVHPSLLPRWRGAAPIVHTILSDDAETGVTVMKLLPKRFDVGPILHQKSIPVPQDCTSQSLCITLANLGADMLVDVLRDLPTYISNQRPQTEDGATHGGKLSSEHAQINWSNSVADICRHYRAISYLIPLHTRWKGQHVVLSSMCIPQNITDLSVKYCNATEGQICYHKEASLLCIKCKDGWVGFEHITIAYRQRLTAKEFFNGYLSSSKSEIQYFS